MVLATMVPNPRVFQLSAFLFLLHGNSQESKKIEAMTELQPTNVTLQRAFEWFKAFVGLNHAGLVVLQWRSNDGNAPKSCTDCGVGDFRRSCTV